MYDYRDVLNEITNNWAAKREDKNITLTNNSHDVISEFIKRCEAERKDKSNMFFTDPITTSTFDPTSLSSVYKFDILSDPLPNPLNQKKVISITPKRIVKNGPALVVFWEDGTKTVVKRKKGEQDNVYHAFTAALAKKLYGCNSAINRIVDGIIDETKKSDKKNKK